MVITTEKALSFVKHYQDFLLSIATPQECEGKKPLEVLALARRRFQADRNLFSLWRAKNKHIEPDVLKAIEGIKIGRWVYLKDTRSYSVFLDDQGEAAYAVLGLTDRLRNLNGHSGIVMECGVFQLDGHYVSDAIFANAVTLGTNLIADINKIYQSLRQSGRFLNKPQALTNDQR